MARRSRRHEGIARALIHNGLHPWHPAHGHDRHGARRHGSAVAATGVAAATGSLAMMAGAVMHASRLPGGLAVRNRIIAVRMRGAIGSAFGSRRTRPRKRTRWSVEQQDHGKHELYGCAEHQAVASFSPIHRQCKEDPIHGAVRRQAENSRRIESACPIASRNPIAIRSRVKLPSNIR
jgi:hypothetical protein